jgi:hypothetical protein
MLSYVIQFSGKQWKIQKPKPNTILFSIGKRKHWCPHYETRTCYLFWKPVSTSHYLFWQKKKEKKKKRNVLLWKSTCLNVQQSKVIMLGTVFLISKSSNAAVMWAHSLLWSLGRWQLFWVLDQGCLTGGSHNDSSSCFDLHVSKDRVWSILQINLLSPSAVPGI